MKFRALLLSCLLFTFQSVLADSASEALRNNLASYNSYEANFSQTTYGGKSKAPQKSQGKIYMQKPGKFRWETTRPYQQVVIANGDTIWIYDVDLGQVSQQSASRHGFNPAQLLTAPVSDLTQRFAISQEGNGWFKLTPIRGNNGFKVAYLQFRDHQLTGLKILNQLNQVNVFTFSDVRINPKLSPSLFRLNVTKKVKVVR